jgi:hypothetical protein
VKGVAYTPFALIASSLLLLIFTVPLGANPQSVETEIHPIESSQTYEHSVGESLENIAEKSLNTNLRGLNKDLVNESRSLENAKQEFISSYSLESNSAGYNTTEVTQEAESEVDGGERLNTDISSLDSVSQEGLAIAGDQKMSYVYTDEILGTRYERRIRDYRASVEGSLDPLNYYRTGEKIRYKTCGYSKPAYRIGSGNETSGFNSIFGEAIVRPENISNVENKDDKIIFTRRTDAQLSDFLAVVTQNESVDRSVEWITDFEYQRPVKNGQNIILKDDEAFVSHFREIIDRKCFVEAGNAPGVFQRMENSTSESSNGILTFNYDSNSSIANEDYNLIGQRDEGVNVSGVTDVGIGDERPWFRVRSENMGYWNLSSLIEN